MNVHEIVAYKKCLNSKLNTFMFGPIRHPIPNAKDQALIKTDIQSSVEAIVMPSLKDFASSATEIIPINVGSVNTGPSTCNGAGEYPLMPV